MKNTTLWLMLFILWTLKPQSTFSQTGQTNPQNEQTVQSTDTLVKVPLRLLRNANLNYVKGLRCEENYALCEESLQYCDQQLIEFSAKVEELKEQSIMFQKSADQYRQANDMLFKQNGLLERRVVKERNRKEFWRWVGISATAIAAIGFLIK